jgi:putative tricarboxylic transport membrane protein
MVEMANALLSGLIQLFAGSTFGLMLLGILIGFAVGILPGLGGPTTLALMLPFVIKMKAFEAFAFLLGMQAVTATTGDITSILFGVPGEPTTAATIVDGHPMAKKGEAGRALGAALMSSLVGAIVGAFALALAVPIVRPLVMFFRSPELFMLAVLGLTFVISLSGDSVLKGFIIGGSGFFLSVVGFDQVSGVQRYTFGYEFLWDGIGLVPVTIGLFAIPEIVDLAVKGSSIAEQHVGKLGGVWEGVKDTFRHLGLVLRCSALGTYTAIIPGMGAAITQWLAYAHAVQSSPHKERFGKGAVEGVLGPGAANNSTLGGSFITTVAFGIPASLTMAILMGAFIIQGIVPGPDMLIPEAKGGHLSLTFSFVWTIIISNIITVSICFIFLQQLAKVTQVRSNLLIPSILLLIYLGAFAEKNAIEDLAIVLFFGAIGLWMERTHWPRPPLVLGLVLGALAENKLFLSTSNYGASWLLNPTVLVLIGLVLFGAFYPFLKARWTKRKGEPKEEEVRGQRFEGKPRRGFGWSTAFTLFLVIVYSLALWQSRRFNFRAGLFPWVIGFPVLALCVLQLFKELWSGIEVRSPDSSGKTEIEVPQGVVRRRTALIVGWTAGFLAAILLLGFAMAAPLCTFLYLLVTREKWYLNLLLTAATWTFFYGFFYRAIHIPFPPGLLF